MAEVITENKLTPGMRDFIEKTQNTMLNLVNEYKSIEDDIHYDCPLNRMMDDLEAFAWMKPENIINDPVDLEEEDDKEM